MVLVCVLIMASPISAGKYQLAYWRELAAWENQAPPAGTYGMHDVWIHVWNEDGTPRPGIEIRNLSGFSFGYTNASGIVHTQLWSSASEFYCRDGSNLYELTPVFDERRWPHSGHYSWEAGFVYRASNTPTGIFDTNYDGVLNSVSGDHCHIDAPRTRSLAFTAANPLEACSDQYATSATVTEAGQTFVATGDRVIAAKAWVTGNPGYIAQILDGGPNGSPVGPPAAASAEDEYQDVRAAWSFDAVPVTPGNTYYLKITRPGGQAFAVQRTLGDNYSGGCFYENKAARTSYELFGAVVMAWSGYGGRGRIAGRVRDIGANPVGGAVVTCNPGGATAQTDAGGCYTLFNIPAGKYSTVASKWGFSKETLYSRSVTAGSTLTVNFDHLVPLTNLLANSGFETGSLSGWTKYDTFNIYGSGDFAVPSRAGSYWAGEVTSGGWGIVGSLAQQVNVTSPYEYQLSAWYLTDAFNGDRAQEFPNDNVCRIGIDPTGSGVKDSANITWSGWMSSHDVWSEASLKKYAQAPYAQMTVWLNYWIRYSHEWNKAGFDDCFFGRSTPVVIIDIEPSAANAQSASADIFWHTNVASDSRVDYGLTASYGQVQSSPDLLTSHGIHLIGLQPNTTYHYKVTSAASGYGSDSSPDYTFTTPRSYTTVDAVSDLRSMPDGTDVYLAAERVTAGADQLAGMFYIQETTSPAGIRVNSADSAVPAGDTRSVYGTLITVDGERCIDCHQTSLASSGNPVPKPYGIRLEDLGGAAAGRPMGVDNVGTLMRVWGRVGASGDDYFYLVSPSGYQVKVVCGSLAKPTGFAAVTGCCGAASSGGLAPVLRVRKQSDID